MGLSEPELVREILREEPEIVSVTPGGIHTGRTDEANQALGTIVVAESGWPKPELYLPLEVCRIRVTCIGPDQDKTNAMKSAILDRLHYAESASQRRVVAQPSTGELFLVHSCLVESGTMSEPSGENRFWQNRMTMRFTFGMQPVEP